MINDAEVMKLHRARIKAYQVYRKIASGTMLAAHESPDPADVKEARDLWLDAEEAYNSAGLTPAELREVIGRNTVTKDVKRVKV